MVGCKCPITVGSMKRGFDYFKNLFEKFNTQIEVVNLTKEIYECL